MTAGVKWFAWIDRLLDRRFILQHHTMEMEVEPMTDSMLAILKEFVAKMKAGYEKMLARLEAKIDANQV
jgi:hypothetical protein